jgi:hypothetical protein
MLTTLFQHYKPVPCPLCGVVHVAPVVTFTGYITAFSLCPVFDQVEDPPQPDTIPIEHPFRSWSAGGNSSTVEPPFFGSTDSSASVVQRAHQRRRQWQAHIASMSSMTSSALLFDRSSSD